MNCESNNFYLRANDDQRKTEQYNATSDQCDCETRDVTKKISKLESGFEMTLEQLQANLTRLQELDMKLNEEDGKVSSLNRRVMLLEVSFATNNWDTSIVQGKH